MDSVSKNSLHVNVITLTSMTITAKTTYRKYYVIDTKNSLFITGCDIHAKYKQYK